MEWTAVNKYTQADSTVRNLTDSYTFTVTPLDKDKKPYSITVTTYDRDVTDADGKVMHKRGEIKTVTKTIGDKKTNIAPTNDVNEAGEVTRIWYDLSVEPVTDENSNETVWKSQPYDVTGTVEKDGGTLYYKAQTVPMLELVQEDGAEPVYRITLPELQEKVQDDSLELQKFTASVTLQTLAHSDDNGKTVESGTVQGPRQRDEHRRCGGGCPEYGLRGERRARRDCRKHGSGKRPRKRAPGPDAGPSGTAHGDPGDRRCPG